MRLIRALRHARLPRSVLLMVCALAAAPAAHAQTGAQTPSTDDAMLTHAETVFGRGDKAAALAEVEQVLARRPEDANALFQSARFNFELGNLDAARGRLERAVKLAGNYAAAWELMIQITQAQGDLKRRDEALARIRIAIRSAIDPNIRRMTTFIRERIRAGDAFVTVADNFGRGGSDFTRYQFSLNDPLANPESGLLLRTDAATTEHWASTALLPPDQPLFHLDAVDPDRGGEATGIYEYYTGEPDYDTVRAKALQILRGEAQPLSGGSGPLSGILRK